VATTRESLEPGSTASGVPSAHAVSAAICARFARAGRPWLRARVVLASGNSGSCSELDRGGHARPERDVRATRPSKPDRETAVAAVAPWGAAVRAAVRSSVPSSGSLPPQWLERGAAHDRPTDHTGAERLGEDERCPGPRGSDGDTHRPFRRHRSPTGRT